MDRRLETSKQTHNYLPDGRVTKKNMFDYGYCWGGMLPMQKDAAVRYARKMQVFKLYQDNSEGEVDNGEDLMNHDGLFGIELDSWMIHLKNEMESRLKNCKLDTEWNGFEKGTRFDTLKNWFEKVFSQPYHLENDLFSDKEGPLDLDISNRNFKLYHKPGDFLKIPLNSDSSLIRNLEWILHRTVEKKEKWDFYYLYFQHAESRIMALNSGKTGSDEIYIVPNIVYGNESEMKQFEEKYKLNDVFKQMFKEEEAI